MIWIRTTHSPALWSRGLLSACLLCAALPAVRAQGTAPHLATYFGGAGIDEIVAVERDPSGRVTLIGHTTSTTIATPGAYQTTTGGMRDAFVARIDPQLPPSQQVLWCTLLGGSGNDYAFDGAVDPVTGVTTVVGLTDSPTFPGAGAPTGRSDGFVAQVSADGTTLVASLLVGGSFDDRLCDVELEPSGIVVVGGVSESPDLPGRTNAHHGGQTDAFVSRVLLAGPPMVLASTYLGSNNTEGLTYASFLASTLWPGNLDRVALALDGQGNAALATASTWLNRPATLTACAVQPTFGGYADVYLAVVQPTGAIAYGTYFGGNYTEYPSTLAAHPDGGFVVGGVTWSTTRLNATPGALQTTNAGGPQSMGGPADGFLAWIDPARCGAAGLRYATYLGGDGGQDIVIDLEVDSAGVVTAVGLCAGGSFRTTHRSHQQVLAAGRYGGYVARIGMDGRGADDLHYSSFVAGSDFSVFNSVDLDAVGDAWFAGAANGGNFPVVNALQQLNAGGREGVLAHMPLLPGGVRRDALASAVPACAARLHSSARGVPVPGQTFGIRANNAPPMGVGALLIGSPTTLGPLLNVTVEVVPIASPAVVADARGAAEVAIPVPASAPTVAMWNLGAQWIFLTDQACPGTGILSSSDRLRF